MKTPPTKSAEPKKPSPVTAAPPSEGRTEAPTTEPAGDPPPSPSFITIDAFREEMRLEREANMNATREMIQSVAQELRPPAEAPRAPVPTAIDDPTDDEIRAAHESGDTNAIVAVNRRLQRAAEERAYRRAGARLDDVDTRLAIGMDAVADTASHVGSQGLPFYKRFKKEIDTALTQVPAEQRLKPSTLKYVHDMIVGANYETLRAEAAEAERRQANEPPVTSQNTRTPQDDNPEAPAFESIVGRGGVEYFQNAGMTADDFARKRGYEDWNDYATNPKSSRALRKEREAKGRFGRAGLH